MAIGRPAGSPISSECLSSNMSSHSGSRGPGDIRWRAFRAVATGLAPARLGYVLFSSDATVSAIEGRRVVAESVSVSTTRRIGERREGASPSPTARGARRGGPPLFSQQLEGVVPGVGADSVEDPEDADRLEQARSFDAADVDDGPPEVPADLSHGRLRLRLIAAEEHVRRAAREVGMEHVGMADDVEALD